VAESHEPSYYEIALTNRQVIVAFVLLLTCILGAFFSGVWIGREATARAAQDQIVRNAPPPQGPQDGKSLDELEFFDAKNKNRKGADHKTAGDKLADKPAGKSAGKTAETAEMQTAAAAPAPAPTLADDLARRTPAVGKKTRTPPPPAPAAEEVAEEPAPAPPPVPRARPVPQPAAPAPAATVPARKGKNRDKTAAATTAPARTGRSATDAANAAGAKGAYVIQVFSSADKTQADRIRAKLAGSGQKAYLSPIERGGRTMYRVRIGPFRSRGDAQTVADKVRKGYKMDTWVTE
jgi:cell division protein FtsN